jgi:hypothetical protein
MPPALPVTSDSFGDSRDPTGARTTQPWSGTYTFEDMVDTLKGIAFLVGLVLLLPVPFMDSTVGTWWTRVLGTLGAFVVARFVIRWARRRYRAGPGLSGFVPRKTPWAS